MTQNDRKLWPRPDWRMTHTRDRANRRGISPRKRGSGRAVDSILWQAPGGGEPRARNASGHLLSAGLPRRSCDSAPLGSQPIRTQQRYWTCPATKGERRERIPHRSSDRGMPGPQPRPCSGGDGETAGGRARPLRANTRSGGLRSARSEARRIPQAGHRGLPGQGGARACPLRAGAALRPRGGSWAVPRTRRATRRATPEGARGLPREGRRSAPNLPARPAPAPSTQAEYAS